MTVVRRSTRRTWRNFARRARSTSASSVRTEFVDGLLLQQERRLITEDEVRFMSIVRAAAELQIGARRFSAVRKRDQVVELEKATLCAAAICAGECALPAVTR